MTKRTQSGANTHLAWLGVDRASHEPLHAQLVSVIREGILRGRLHSGVRLPSSRDLAAQCGVSRNTVLDAYSQLTAEGYLDGRPGAGTFVSDSLPDAMLRVAAAPVERPRLSSQGARFTGGSTDPGSGQPGPFRLGVPAVDRFPIRVWSRLVAQIWRDASSSVLGYDDDAGFAPLREQVASYASATRGVDCDPSRVIIVSGSQQALDLTARILINPGEGIWIEDPAYVGARRTFVSSGARLHPVAVDGDGMAVSEISLQPTRARMVYVTPSHQYPLGSTLSLERRIHLLDWASRHDGWIIEDDYDSDFRYTSRPLPSLQGMDRSGRVIYVGTFSKILLPSIRIGYVIAPPSLVPAYRSARVLSGRGTSVVEQAALAEMIRRGQLDRHLRRMRTLYGERQDRLISLIRARSGGLLQVTSSDAGMHLVGWLPEGVSDQRVHELALRKGVEVSPLSAYSVRPIPGAVLLGYGGVPLEAMPSAVDLLVESIREAMAADRP